MLQKPNEKNRDLIVNINGKLVHRDQAGIIDQHRVAEQFCHGLCLVGEGLRKSQTLKFRHFDLWSGHLDAQALEVRGKGLVFRRVCRDQS